MGKASSSKKVARAARAAAASRPGERRNLGFPLVVALIVVLGVSIIAWAKANREVSAAPRLGDHWHSSYDIYVCDDYITQPILDQTDPNGIHTHADGLIHVHPFNSTATGEKAQLKVFFDAFGGSIDDEGITLDTGERIEEGEDCNGEPTEFKVLRYDANDLDASPQVIEDDLGDIRLRKTREAFVFAFIPDGADLPKPSEGRLDALDRVDPEYLGDPDFTGVPDPDGSTTTTAGDGEATTTTAGDGTADDSTTTTVTEDTGEDSTTSTSSAG